MMMNDMQLDELLTQWKTERTPGPKSFTSQEYFERSFFAKVRAEKKKHARKKTVMKLSDLIRRISPPTLHAQLRPSGTMANACFSACVPPAISLRPSADKMYMRDIGRIELFSNRSEPAFDTEEYKTVGERPFVAAATNPLSTFGADVDTAMYAYLRRMILEEDRLPPSEAVRIEELLNYFHYDYPLPEKDEVLRPHFELDDAPWAPERKLLLIGVQAKIPVREGLPPSHYVFLIDNSGSMHGVFPMVKKAMKALAQQLKPDDRVSMVTYGGNVKVLLEGCSDITKVCHAIRKLEAAGCTPGGEAIQTAYCIAEKHLIPNGNNRIVLITDGDFNVGASSEAALVEMVREKRETGIYLSIAGCGVGNYKDNKLKMLANKGNGNVFYLDSFREAERVFVHGMTGNMYALAKDVKFQIEFNPGQVFAYRLLGYELRDMTDSDFRDDRKESGTVGLGQQVTALYEIIPANASKKVKNTAVPGMKPLKYASSVTSESDELLTFRIRWKKPRGRAAAKEDSVAVKPSLPTTANWHWAAAVAEFGLALRGSRFAPGADMGHAVREARKYLGDDPNGDHAEFLLMLRRAEELRKK